MKLKSPGYVPGFEKMAVDGNPLGNCVPGLKATLISVFILYQKPMVHALDFCFW